MKNIIKKSLSVILTVAMLLSFASTVFAAEEETSTAPEEPTTQVEEETSAPEEAASDEEEKRKYTDSEVLEMFGLSFLSPFIVVLGLLLTIFLPGPGWLLGPSTIVSGFGIIPAFFSGLIEGIIWRFK